MTERVCRGYWKEPGAKPVKCMLHNFRMMAGTCLHFPDLPLWRSVSAEHRLRRVDMWGLLSLMLEAPSRGLVIPPCGVGCILSAHRESNTWPEEAVKKSPLALSFGPLHQASQCRAEPGWRHRAEGRVGGCSRESTEPDCS